MKKILLFILVFGMAYTISAQTRKAVSTQRPKNEVLMEPPASSVSTVVGTETDDSFTTTQNSRDITFTKIGSAGNAYGYYGDPRTYVWADPMVNSVVFTHRMLGGTEQQGNSRIAYDVSTDGGTNWTDNVQVYTPLGPDPGTGYPLAAGRYPQGAILNPEGNTDPASAFYTYFICTLDNTNGDNGIWGGYAYGVNPLTVTDPPAPTQTNLSSEGDYYRLIPDAFTVTQQGVAWYVDGSFSYDGTNYNYTGNLILGRGELNDDGTDIVYQEDLISFLYPMTATDEGLNDSKIAFAPDGQTGYICEMAEVMDDPTPYTSYHPILLKTTDGGESWSDPIDVQLGGADGIESLKNYFPDSAIINAGYDPGFNRDEVYYNMGFQVDLIVDENGNPYITGVIAIGNADGWFPNEGQMATWNVYSDDGGTTWNADALYDNIWLQADIGAIVQYNRPYASSTYDGHYLFFSWLDSDLDVAEQNDRPNIFVIGYDVEDHTYSGDVQNVTLFTQAWNRAFYGSQSQYVFANLDEGNQIWNCEIPFVYEEFTVPGDDTQPCDFWYIDGYTLDMPVGTNEIKADINDVAVSQNQPNPASNMTKIMVTGKTNQPIQLTVSNMLGQVVYTNQEQSGALLHTFNVNVSNFDSGIYLYTVKIGNKTTTKKMMVE